MVGSVEFVKTYSTENEQSALTAKSNFISWNLKFPGDIFYKYPFMKNR